jgi:serine/threonine-protein kinase Chk2
MLYICLCGFPPFSDELRRPGFPYSLADQIRGALFDYPTPYWDAVSDLAMDLIDGMLVVDMSKRFNVKQCSQHRWLAEAPLVVYEGDEGVRSGSPGPVDVDVKG